MSVLLGTRLRKKLLAYSFMHENEDFYVREIASLIAEDAGNLSRELKKLEQEGLFTSHIRGREKFYSLNTRYPLFRELKKIVLKTEGIEEELKRLVNSFTGLTFAFIYGSYIKGKLHKTSDIDLVVVGDLSEREFMSKIRKLEQQVNREINFTVYTQEDFNKEKRKKGSFLDVILKDKIIVLKGKLHV